MKTKTYLFVGGQHHGKMLPISEASLQEAASQIGAVLRAEKGSRPYPGYTLATISLSDGGVRHIAVRRRLRETPERLASEMLDAFAVALENHERVLAKIRKLKRNVPLNDDLPDDPGVPAGRETVRSDSDTW